MDRAEAVPSKDANEIQSNERSSWQASRNLSHLPEEELDKLVEDATNVEDRPRGTFIADGGTANDDQERNIAKQLLKASLVKGYVSNEMVAVDISNRIDFEYGNMGPMVNPDQQLINNGKLFAENKDAVLGTEKQRRYRSLIKLRSMGPAMSDELEALEQDEDVHSVSEVSMMLGDRPSENDKPCSIDCALKMHLKNVSNSLSKLPDLDRFEVEDLVAADMEVHRNQVYEELKPGQMRTLELRPGNFGDPVECKLQAESIKGLDDLKDSSSASDSGYEALSYTWGKQLPQFSISCNGTPFWVGRSLFFALQHLRRQDKPSVFWIDAVCIDQKNEFERAGQVRQMLKIYQGAERVVVWLGEESSDSHYAFESMKYLDSFRNERHDIWNRSHTPNCYAVLDRIHQAHANMFTRPWFSRSWIRQEISAANDVMVVCGRDTLGWYPLKRSSGRLSDIQRMLKEDPEFKPEFSVTESNI